MYRKVNGVQTDKQTDKQTERHTERQTESIEGELFRLAVDFLYGTPE